MRNLQTLLRNTALALLLAIILALAACINPNQPTNFKGVVKVGVAVPLTGDLADGGNSVAQGVQFQADQINSRGGAGGYKIEVVIKDDAADDDTAVQVAQELVAEGVKMVVGHYNSGQSAAAGAVYQRAGIIQITPTSSNPDLTRQGWKNFFRVNPTDDAQGSYLAQYMITNLNKRRIAIIHDGSDYAKGLQEQFSKEAQQKGAQIVAREQIKPGSDDYRPALQTVKAANPDLLFAAIDFPEAKLILRQKREVGLEATWLSGDATFQYEVLLDAGQAGEGAYISAFSPNVRAMNSAEAKAFVDQFRQKFQRNPGADAYPGALALEVWARAATSVNSVEPTAVEGGLRQINFTAPIVNTPIQYDDKGDLRNQIIYLTQIRDGQFVPVDTRK